MHAVNFWKWFITWLTGNNSWFSFCMNLLCLQNIYPSSCILWASQWFTFAQIEWKLKLSESFVLKVSHSLVAPSCSSLPSKFRDPSICCKLDHWNDPHRAFLFFNLCCLSELAFSKLYKQLPWNKLREQWSGHGQISSEERKGTLPVAALSC